MMKRKNSKLFLIVALILLVTSCTDSNGRNTSRNTRSSSIVPISEDGTSSVGSMESESKPSQNYNETNTPEWGGSLSDKPERFEFDISYSDDILIVDYGKKTVSAYEANYLPYTDSWGDDWFTYGYTFILSWCRGEDISTTYKVYSPDYEISLQNLQRVKLVTLNDLNDSSEVARRLDLNPHNQVLCWEYNVKDFPKPFAEELNIEAMLDVESIDYVRISAQYIDGLPVYGGSGFFGNATYEWDGVIQPSRKADEGITDSVRINPSKDCLYYLTRARYTTTKELLSDSPVVDPLTCLDEIKKSILYNPCSVYGPHDLYDVWGTKIEVYCMELCYISLDPNPKDWDEPEESIQAHNLYLVPVWEVYYTVYDPEINKVCQGFLMINAVNGQSLFSSTIGHDENTYLYPEPPYGI